MIRNNAINQGQYTFSGFLTNTIANVTGDGTIYTPVMDNIFVNDGNCYAAGTYTAGISGNYLVSYNVTVGNLSNTHTALYMYPLVTNGGAGRRLGNMCNPYAIVDSVYSCATLQSSQIITIAAGDGILFELLVSGGAKTVSLVGNVALQCYTTNISVCLII